MAKILAYQPPAMGHFFPISVRLTKLRNRGHDVALRTLAAGVNSGLDMGFATEPVDPGIEAMPLDDGGAANPQEASLRARRVLTRRAEYEVPDLRKAIDDVRPDALIVDPNCWGASAVAEASGLPWLSFWAFLPYLRSQGVPPWGPGLRPWPGQVGRLRDALYRRKFAALDSWVRPHNKIRARFGLRPLTSPDDYVRRPPLVLVATAQPFDYPHPDWDDSIQFIGACSYDPAPSTVPDWLAQIERPIVLVSTSSEDQGDSGLARVALAALAEEQVHVVATLPAGVPEEIGATGQCHGVRVRAPQRGAGARDMRHHPRRNGRHPEGFGARSTGNRSAVWTRSVRGRAARGGDQMRHSGCCPSISPLPGCARRFSTPR